ncbi:hypothetical protein PI125_g12579 [Phytophthora idaei]|nr:hypothetical protein PI125_g12579 [Phytophthora idaei]
MEGGPDDPEQPPSFPVVTLQGSPSSREVSFNTENAVVSWTEDRGPEPRSVAWTPREKLLGAGDELPRFESDVYSLGMTTIEAVTQEPPFGAMDDEEIMDKIIIGEHYPKPKEATDDEWSLISQLCAVHMEDRMSLEEAIDEIYKLQRREINFPVESLEGSPSSRKLLASITAKYLRTKSCSGVC